MHVGSVHFVPNLMNRVITELNELAPDLIVCTGDFTNEGFRQEYKTAAAYLQQLRPRVVAVPGNHDARNVGYIHFEEMIGPRHWRVELDGVVIVGADSSEPDLDHGQIGRERYGWIAEQFATPAELKIYVQHHHLLPIPGTGRERNILYDANSGTCSSLRLLGNTKPCYNVIEVDSDEVTIHRKYPFGPSSVIAHFNYLTGEQYRREIESVVRQPEPSA